MWSFLLDIAYIIIGSIPVGVVAVIWIAGHATTYIEMKDGSLKPEDR